MNKENYVDTKSLAKHFRVTRETIRLWRLKGLPCVQYGPRTFRYDIETVEEWMRKTYKNK